MFCRQIESDSNYKLHSFMHVVAFPLDLVTFFEYFCLTLAAVDRNSGPLIEEHPNGLHARLKLNGCGLLRNG